MSTHSKDLDLFVDQLLNEGIRKSAGRTTGLYDLVDRMATCNLTRQHLPDHLLEILFGEQLLSPGRIASIPALELKTILNPGEETLGVLTDKWLGKQGQEKSMTKDMIVTRNSIKPEVADIIRRRLSQIINLTTGIFADGICEQLLIVNEFVSQMFRALGYLLPEEEEGASAATANITKEIDNIYLRVGGSYSADPRLNHGRFRAPARQALRDIDFLFFPILAAAISTGSAANVKLDIVKEAANTFREKLRGVKGMSATEQLLQDFVRAAFYVPGQDINAVIRDLAPLLKSAEEKLRQLERPGLDDIKNDLLRDFLRKSKDSVQQVYRAIVLLNPPDAAKMNDILSDVLKDIQSS